MTTYDGESNSRGDENDPRKWTDQHQISQSASFDVPALGVFQDTLFMAWRGVEGDENLYWTSYNENTGMWNNQSPPLTDRGSTEGPALVEFQGNFYMVWKGVSGIDEDDRRLFWATFDPNDPHQWTNENIICRASPAPLSSDRCIDRRSRSFKTASTLPAPDPSIAGSPGLPDTGEGVDSQATQKRRRPPRACSIRPLMAASLAYRSCSRTERASRRLRKPSMRTFHLA